MIFKVDAKTLEWRTYIEWSRDKVGLEELSDPTIDIHSDNQKRWKLPQRVIAKVFLFRWIYRGSAWSYANDADFMHVSSDPKFWQKIIDAANEKYSGLYEFQNRLITMAEDGEIITIPSGREFEFKMTQSKKGDWFWDIKKIVNYPNQGFAADLMVIARISLYNRLKKWKEFNEGKIKLFSTVHDDIEIDVDNIPELCYNISIESENVFRDIPENFRRLYKTDFVTPMAGEVSFGPNLLDLQTFDNKKGIHQFTCKSK